MTVERYINGEPYYGDRLPPMEVENPGIVMVLLELQRRAHRQQAENIRARDGK